MVKLQLSGNMTIANSKKLSQEEKERALQAEEGKVKVIRTVFIDVNGNEVVFTGKMYKSSNGSLTARLLVKLDNFEVVEIDDPKLKQDSKQSSEDKKKDQVAEITSALGL